MSNYNVNRSERDVGITLRLGNHPRFNAVFKDRFSDFHVNEIDPSGNIVHLTSFSPPINNQAQVALDDPEIVKCVEESVRKEVASLQDGLIDKTGDKQQRIKINATNLDKEGRTKIHKWIASFDKLSSETGEEGDQKFIVVIPRTGNPRCNRRPAHRLKYTHCVMYKEGVETSEAIGYIAKKLNLKPGLISYAGIKDKRAKTTQRIAVSNVEANRLIGISKWAKGIKLGNFEYQARPISLGDLGGNHFKILLKNVQLLEDFKGDLNGIIEKALESFKSIGFINYFGMQRFGSFEISTADVGKKILQQNWIEAFDMILKINPKDAEWMRKAKKLWLEERNAEEATKALPQRHRSIESHLLHGLKQFYAKNDYLNAFLRIPRHVRLLYIHAYQSWLWNRAASYRIQEYGLLPIPGDLVYENAGIDVDIDLDINLIDDESDVAPILPPVPYTEKPKVKFLTEEDCSSKKWGINDVLIPQYGTEVKLPLNKTKDYLEKVLKEEGVGMDCFLKYRPVTDSPKGAYRRVVVLPKNVSCEVKSYQVVDGSSSETPLDMDSFILSDLDKLLQAKVKDKPKKEEVEAEKGGEKRCVILEFSLPPSSYATMALREFLEDDQFKLNDKHKRNDCEEEKGDIKKRKLE